MRIPQKDENFSDMASVTPGEHTVAPGQPIESTSKSLIEAEISTNPEEDQEELEIQYRLMGGDIQFVILIIPPGRSIIAEAGAMTSMEEDIKFTPVLSDNPESSIASRILSAGKRILVKESALLTLFHNQSDSRAQEVIFSSPYPGQIIPIDLSEYNGALFCQKGSFLCATERTQINVSITKRLAAGLWGGEGFILTKIEGDGLVFVHAGGTIIKKELKDEKLRVETGSVVCFSSGLDYSVQPITNLKSLLFGGEGCFLTTFKGTGIVYLQSLPFKNLCKRIFQNTPAYLLKSSRSNNG